MEYKNCIFKTDEKGVALLTLSRPEELNALTMEMADEITAICHLVNQDPNVKVLVITGNGRGFSSGGSIPDVKTMQDRETAKSAVEKIANMVQVIYHLKKPVVGALNGPVAGAAIAMLLACDIILAAEAASISFPFSRLGFCPDCGTSWLLLRAVGRQRASEIVMFGKTLSAQYALQLGIVNEITMAEALMTTVMQRAEFLAHGPSIAYEYDKTLLHNAAVSSFDQHILLESMYQVYACQTEDFKEGINAYIEKRKPAFKGK